MLVSTGRVVQSAGSGIEAWAFGGKLEAPVSTRFSARVSYEYQTMSGASLNVTAVGSTLTLPALAGSCVSLDAFMAWGAGMPESDAYHNLTVPLQWGIARPIHSRVVAFVGAAAIYSFTDARLFSFQLTESRWGYGAIAGTRLHYARFIIDFSLRATSIGSAIGPQPLGRIRTSVAIGLGL
jgi:hypothetical protein